MALTSKQISLVKEFIDLSVAWGKYDTKISDITAKFCKMKDALKALLQSKDYDWDMREILLGYAENIGATEKDMMGIEMSLTEFLEEKEM